LLVLRSGRGGGVQGDGRGKEGGTARLVGIEGGGDGKTALMADRGWSKECLNTTHEEDGVECWSMHYLDGFEMTTCCFTLYDADGKLKDTFLGIIKKVLAATARASCPPLPMLGIVIGVV